MAAERQVRVTVLGDSSSGQRALNTLADSGDTAANRLGGVGTKISAALDPSKIRAGFSTASAGIGIGLAEIGDKYEKSTKQLEAAAAAAGIPLEQLDEITKSADRSMENFGHTNTQTNAALQALVQAGRPADEVQKDLALSADLAAAKHISLSDAASLIAKVYGGNSKVLKQFGIDLKAVGGPGAAIDELTGKLQGQAAASVDTFGGKMEIAKVKVEDFIMKGAARIGPAMVAAGPALAGFGGLIQSGLVPALASGVGSAAKFAFGMAEAGLSAAAAALPVLIAWAPVILAIAAIGIAAYVLYKNWDEVWGFIKGIASTAADFVKDHMELIALVVLAPLAPLILLVAHWDEAWGVVKNITGDAWSWLRDTVSGGISDVVGFVAGLPGRAVGALSSLGGDLRDEATGAMGSMLDAVENGAGDVEGFVEGIPFGIIDSMGNLDDLLWDAGAAVLRGFLNGLKSVWGDVTGFVGKIGGWIADHKGPLDYDRKLLVPHGMAIMTGLGEGIQTGRRTALASALTAVTGQIADADMGAARTTMPGQSQRSGLASMAAAASSAGASLTVAEGAIIVYALDPQGAAMGVRDELVKYGRRVPSLGLSS